MGREVLYKYFNEKGFKIGAEIGVQAGINAFEMFRHIHGLKLYLVDPWENKRAYRRTIKRVSPYNAVIIRKKSEDAIHDIPDRSLCYVYFDGDHTYNGLTLDMILWEQKVKDGGIISGHDYRRGSTFGVKAAVDNYVKYHKIDLKLSEGKNWYWET